MDLQLSPATLFCQASAFALGLGGLLVCSRLGDGVLREQPAVPPPAASAAPEPVVQPALPASVAPAAPEQTLGVQDRGIFSDLDAQLQLTLPARLDPSRVRAVYDLVRELLVVYEDKWPLKVYPVRADASAVLELGALRLGLRAGDRAELAALLDERRVETLNHGAAPPGDADGDGIPDPLDVLLGAHKTALNADRYDGRYQSIPYPLGDVPRSIGVCTDVVIRSLRNAGIDLQREVHEDILRAPAAYPSVSRPNSSIDHRRVRSLLPYFERHFEAHAAVATAADPYRPGDIVFMDTFPRQPGPDHVGIISDQRSPEGVLLVINNWTTGTVTEAMDLLSYIPVMQRFRVPPARPAGPVAANISQLVLVTSDDFTDWHGRLQRYERSPGKPFRRVGAAEPVVLGAAGYGWGDGLHGRGAPAQRPGPLKREGDLRSPAGVFALGTLHGYAAALRGVRLPYQQASAAQRCVDDPASPHYNRIVSIDETGEPWRSAEHMLRDDGLYELALDIEHNRAPVTPGHGSCIFAHVWAGPDVPVSGCTALAKSDLRRLLAWLKPDAAVWVALPEPEYRALRAEWGLP
ncbi:MAG TPA: DUF1287 domain-containing protein [Polyangiaceae bacterium]|nr:DUF1287 domain-containing protein [Polyangiaceae bacterium]